MGSANSRKLQSLSLAVGSPRTLCERCQRIEFFRLSSTSSRWPDDAYNCAQHIAPLRVIREQARSCPLCSLFLRILSTDRCWPHDGVGSYEENDDVALVYERKDCVLYGFHLGNPEDQEPIENCFTLEHKGNTYHDKIVLSHRGGRENFKCAQGPLLSEVYPVKAHVDFKLIRSWLDTCVDHHKTVCEAKSTMTDDTEFKQRQRVIDVQARIVVHRDLASTGYAALTYVWGANFAQRVTNSLAKIAISGDQLPIDLPQTFLDAMTVCVELGIDFLWIDALCIDQRDPVDKEAQIRNMDLVYKGSRITIVASEGPDPDFGLPGVSRARAYPSCSVVIDGDGGPGSQVSVVPGFIPGQCTWDKRAWTLQEAVLSTRLLVFNGHYAAFFCCGGATREDLSSIDSQALVGEKKKTSMTNWVLDFASSTTIDLLSGFRMSSYRELVKLYTSRKMANPMDALNAVSGLLAHWRNITQTEFVMGHPTEFLSDSLIWVGKNYHHRGHPGIPSWSWAAWEGNVVYSYEIEEQTPRAHDNLDKIKEARKHDFDNGIVVSCKLLKWRHLAASRLERGYSGAIGLDAVIEVLDGPNQTPRLMIHSYVARVKMPVMSGKHTGSSLDWHYWFPNDTPRGFYEIALVEKPGKLCIVLSEDDREPMNIQLPDDLTLEQAEELRSKGAEFVMLKHWYTTGWRPEQYLIWALLIQRKGDVAERLGCMAIVPEVWNRLSPKLEKIMLV